MSERATSGAPPPSPDFAGLVVTARIGANPMHIADEEIQAPIWNRVDLNHTAWPADHPGRHCCTLSRLVHQLRPVRAPSVDVFAFAPIPLLVGIGAVLGDQRRVRTWQHHRRTGRWRWPGDRPAARWTFEPADRAHHESVIRICVSGVVAPAEVPLRDLPQAELRVDDPGVERLSRAEDVPTFLETWRRALAAARGQGVRTLHVFAAVPLSLAVALGTARLQADPELVVWERRGATWSRTVAIPGALDDSPWYDVFIGFQGDARADALALSRALEPDLRVFVDESGIQAGQVSQTAIDQALRRSALAVFLFDPDQALGAHMQNEVTSAIELHKCGQACLEILPVSRGRLNNSLSMPIELRRFQAVSIETPTGLANVVREQAGRLAAQRA